jgi:hypothetical protein
MSDPFPPEPASPLPAIVCGAGGAIASFMGVAMWVTVLGGGRVHSRNTGADLSAVDSALLATFILAIGIAMCWGASKLSPPRK